MGQTTKIDQIGGCGLTNFKYHLDTEVQSLLANPEKRFKYNQISICFKAQLANKRNGCFYK